MVHTLECLKYADINLKTFFQRVNRDEVFAACLLHDIGLRYMTIDYNNQDIATLNKQELIEYKKHPIYGYSSLKSETWISDLSKAIILFKSDYSPPQPKVYI